MHYEDTLESLKNVHQKLMSVKWSDASFLTIIDYELMPTIKACDTLNQDFNRLVDAYIKNLPKEKRDQKLWNTYQLWTFGDLYMLVNDKQARSSALIDENRFMLYRLSLDFVCNKFVSCVERILVSEKNKKPKQGRPPNPPKQSEYKEDNILWNGKSCKLTANSFLARLCEKMLSSGIKIGKREAWVDVYEYVYEIEPQDNKKWRKIYSRVLALNKKLSKKNIHSVLKFDGGSKGYVTRIL